MFDIFQYINIEEVRLDINKNYVGFKPSGDSVKPVHIASGAQRCLYGAYNSSKSIKCMALAMSPKGVVAKGCQLDEVYNELRENGQLQEGIRQDELGALRIIMQKLLSADKGVYITKDLSDNMLSFTAGSKFFLTGRATLYEDAGEFAGTLVRKYCPELAAHIRKILDEAADPISAIFTPLLDELDDKYFDSASDYVKEFEQVEAFKDCNAAVNRDMVNRFTKGLAESGTTLLGNISHYSNPLYTLRQFNLFCIFQIIRYMTMLPSFYCDEPERPMLLDFSGRTLTVSGIARASEMSFQQISRAIDRFYAWGYARWLHGKSYSLETLLKSATPVYKRGRKADPDSSSVRGKRSSRDKTAQLEARWEFAKQQARACRSDTAASLLPFGEAIRDMLGSEASSNPTAYFRILGTGAGIMYPPNQPHRRYRITQDVLEMLLYSCVNCGETIHGTELRRRLWDRLGVIIGGTQFEMNKIRAGGLVMQNDADALEQNFADFAGQMQLLGFADNMADGILQVRL